MKRTLPTNPSSSAYLLYGNLSDDSEYAQLIKRRRFDFDYSKQLIGSQEMPTTQQAIMVAINMVRFLTSKHTILTSDTGKRVPFAYYDVNPFCFSSTYMKEVANIDTSLSPNANINKPIENGTISLGTILGSVQRQLFLNTLIEMAQHRVAKNNTKTPPLGCHLCGNSQTMQLTIAKEHGVQCQHPWSHEKIVWAIDDETGETPFTSQPMADDPDERTGHAICIKCFYEELICKDRVHTLTLGSWYQFQECLDNNINATPVEDTMASIPQMPLCSILYGNAGRICLCRFSILTPAHRFTPKQNEYRGPLADPREYSEAASLTAVTSLSSGSNHFLALDQHVNINIAYSIVNQMNTEIERTAASFGQASGPPSPQDAVTLLSVISTRLLSLDTTTKSTLDLLAAGKGMLATPNLKNFDEALNFLNSNRQFIEQITEAKQTLVEHVGDKALFYRESSTQEANFCVECGGYGHSMLRTCAMLSKPGFVKTRGGKALIEHYTENIKNSVKDQKPDLHKAVELDKWHTDTLLNTAIDYNQRIARGQPYSRGAPSLEYLSKRAGGKEAIAVTPSTPSVTLASMNPAQFASLVKLEQFTEEAILAYRDAWISIGFDVSDMEVYMRWIEEDKIQVVTGTPTEKYHKRLSYFYNFVRRYHSTHALTMLNQQEEVPASEPTPAATESHQVQEDEDALF